MKNFRFIYAVLILFLITSQLQSQATTENAFDFWVGEWELHWYGPDSTLVKGNNRIEKILDGKVLQEHFTDPSSGFKGTSISVYNSRQDSWYQSWADNSGGYFHFKGITAGGKRIFSMTEENEQGVLYRMVFSEIGPNSLVWTWEGTRDGGNTWKTAWKIYYERKNP
jgi:hypothetical protein